MGKNFATKIHSCKHNCKSKNMEEENATKITDCKPGRKNKTQKKIIATASKRLQLWLLIYKIHFATIVQLQIILKF